MCPESLPWSLQVCPPLRGRGEELPCADAPGGLGPGPRPALCSRPPGPRRPASFISHTPPPPPILGLRPRSPALTEVTASQISAAQIPGDGGGGLRQGRLPGQLGALHGGGPASSAWGTCWERTGWVGEMQPLCSRACGLRLWAWKGAGPGATWPLCFWPSMASTGLRGSRCRVVRSANSSPSIGIHAAFSSLFLGLLGTPGI